MGASVFLRVTNHEVLAMAADYSLLWNLGVDLDIWNGRK